MVPILKAPLPKRRRSPRQPVASARVKYSPTPKAPLQAGDLVLDVEKRVVSCDNGKVKLTPKECRLLGAFMSNGGQVLTREYLMKEVWDTDYMGDTRTLDVHIRYLRVKIEKDPDNPERILTIRGVGYRLGLP